MKGKIKYIVFSILVILLICLIYFIESGKIIPFDDAVYSLIAGNITEEKKLGNYDCTVRSCHKITTLSKFAQLSTNAI